MNISFSGEENDRKEPGLYKSAHSGEILFSSKDIYDTGKGAGEGRHINFTKPAAIMQGG